MATGKISRACDPAASAGRSRPAKGRILRIRDLVRGDSHGPSGPTYRTLTFVPLVRRARVWELARFRYIVDHAVSGHMRQGPWPGPTCLARTADHNAQFDFPVQAGRPGRLQDRVRGAILMQGSTFRTRSAQWRRTGRFRRRDPGNSIGWRPNFADFQPTVRPTWACRAPAAATPESRCRKRFWPSAKIRCASIWGRTLKDRAGAPNDRSGFAWAHLRPCFDPSKFATASR